MKKPAALAALSLCRGASFLQPPAAGQWPPSPGAADSAGLPGPTHGQAARYQKSEHPEMYRQPWEVTGNRNLAPPPPPRFTQKCGEGGVHVCTHVLAHAHTHQVVGRESHPCSLHGPPSKTHEPSRAAGWPNGSCPWPTGTVPAGSHGTAHPTPRGQMKAAATPRGRSLCP